MLCWIAWFLYVIRTSVLAVDVHVICRPGWTLDRCWNQIRISGKQRRGALSGTYDIQGEKLVYSGCVEALQLHMYVLGQCGASTAASPLSVRTMLRCVASWRRRQ